MNQQKTLQTYKNLTKNFNTFSHKFLEDMEVIPEKEIQLQNINKDAMYIRLKIKDFLCNNNKKISGGCLYVIADIATTMILFRKYPKKQFMTVHLSLYQSQEICKDQTLNMEIYFVIKNAWTINSVCYFYNEKWKKIGLADQISQFLDQQQKEKFSLKTNFEQFSDFNQFQIKIMSDTRIKSCKTKSIDKENIMKEVKNFFKITVNYDAEKLKRFYSSRKKDRNSKIFFLSKLNKKKTFTYTNQKNQIHDNSHVSNYTQKCFKKSEIKFKKNLDNIKQLQEEIEADGKNIKLNEIFQRFQNSVIQQNFQKDIDLNDFKINQQNYLQTGKNRNIFTDIWFEFFSKNKQNESQIKNLSNLQSSFVELISVLKQECLQKGQLLENFITYTFQIYEQLARKKFQQMFYQGKQISEKILRTQKHQKQKLEEQEKTIYELKQQFKEFNIMHKIVRQKNKQFREKIHKLETDKIYLSTKCQKLYQFWSNFDEIRKNIEKISSLVPKQETNQIRIILNGQKQLLYKIDLYYSQFTRWVNSNHKDENMKIQKEKIYLLDNDFLKNKFNRKNKQTQTIHKEFKETDTQTLIIQQDQQMQTENEAKILVHNKSQQTKINSDAEKQQKKMLKLKEKYEMHVKRKQNIDELEVIIDQKQNEKKSFNLKKFWNNGPKKIKRKQKQYAYFKVPFPNHSKYYYISQIINQSYFAVQQQKISNNFFRNIYKDLAKFCLNKNKKEFFMQYFFDYFQQKYVTKKYFKIQCLYLVRAIEKYKLMKNTKNTDGILMSYLIDINSMTFANYYGFIMMQALQSLSSKQFKKQSKRIFDYEQNHNQA